MHRLGPRTARLGVVIVSSALLVLAGWPTEVASERFLTPPIRVDSGPSSLGEANTSSSLNIGVVIQPAPPATAFVANLSAVIRSPLPAAVALPQIYSPALGISGKVYAHDVCGGLIDDHIYEYGCVGTNNLYLLGHSFTVFRGLNAAYHSGVIKVGVPLWYTDSAGRTWRYRVAQVRHVAMSAYATWEKWATGNLAKSGITLQTCDGPATNPELYRIVVRLYRG